MAAEQDSKPYIHKTKASLIQQTTSLLIETSMIPFYVLLAFYITMFSPYTSHVDESLTVVFFKVLPIWYLAALVYQRRVKLQKHFSFSKQRRAGDSSESSGVSENVGIANGDRGESRRRINITESGSTEKGSVQDQINDGSIDNRKDSGWEDEVRRTLSYQKLIVFALSISSLGDAALVYNHLFKVGVLSFAVAQVVYFCALRKYYIRARFAWLAVPSHFVLYFSIVPFMEENIMRVMIFAYSLLLHGMLFFAIASYESRPSVYTMCSAIGAASFVVSDFLIGFNKWCFPFRFANILVMIFYYTAQLLLTSGIPRP